MYSYYPAPDNHVILVGQYTAANNYITRQIEHCEHVQVLEACLNPISNEDEGMEHIRAIFFNIALCLCDNL